MGDFAYSTGPVDEGSFELFLSISVGSADESTSIWKRQVLRTSCKSTQQQVYGLF